MSLDASIKAGYAPGGVYYNNIKAAYGAAAADAAYRASLTASQRSEITDAVNKYRAQVTNPNEGTTSFWGNLWRQVTTNPLQAPIESANNQIGNVVVNVLKNPWVLATIALLIFHALGGFDWLKRKLASA